MVVKRGSDDTYPTELNGICVVYLLRKHSTRVNSKLYSLHAHPVGPLRAFGRLDTSRLSCQGMPYPAILGHAFASLDAYALL